MQGKDKNYNWKHTVYCVLNAALTENNAQWPYRDVEELDLQLRGEKFDLNNTMENK